WWACDLRPGGAYVEAPLGRGRGWFWAAAAKKRCRAESPPGGGADAAVSSARRGRTPRQPRPAVERGPCRGDVPSRALVSLLPAEYQGLGTGADRDRTQRRPDRRDHARPAAVR